VPSGERRFATGKVLISDGPFAETNEQIGGYCPIDRKDLDEAIEVASATRRDALGGTMSLTCPPGRGTSIVVNFPVQVAAGAANCRPSA
jgi:hypothetical protein